MALELNEMNLNGEKKIMEAVKAEEKWEKNRRIP
jgi:hypothetical protein